MLHILHSWLVSSTKAISLEKSHTHYLKIQTKRNFTGKGGETNGIYTQE